MIGLPADDRRYYPLYAKCVELGRAGQHPHLGELDHREPSATSAIRATSTWWPPTSRSSKIIMSHAGYPWVLEAVLLAWKYPNVYLELAAHRPRYLAAPGTGWEPLLRFGPRTIRDKVLFGTGWFLLGRPPGQILDEFRALPGPGGRDGAVALRATPSALLGVPVTA